MNDIGEASVKRKARAPVGGSVARGVVKHAPRASVLFSTRWNPSKSKARRFGQRRAPDLAAS